MKFFSNKNKSISNTATSSLFVETLEPRMMLSTVSIFASGETGQENIEVEVSGQVALAESNVSTQGQVFTLDVADGTKVDDLRIRFTNDLYQPDQGYDRNLTIEKVVFDGVEYQGDGDSVFSTGTWLPEDGVAPGLGRGSTLHSNGFLKFSEATAVDTIEWRGETWQAIGPFTSDQVRVDPQYDEIVVSGGRGPISISRQVDVVGDQLFSLSVDAYRNVIEGQFTNDNQPWATTGVNFYNNNGALVGQRTLEFNSPFTDPSNGLQSTEDVTPPGATTAFVWIWIDNFDASTNIPIIVRDISFTQIDLSADTTPPTASVVGVTSFLPDPREFYFIVEYNDETHLDFLGTEAIRVTGPNGYNQLALPRAPLVFTEQTRQVIYAMVNSDRDWGAADNGTYLVFLTDNSLADLAGNFAEGGLLGTFEVSIA